MLGEMATIVVFFGAVALVSQDPFMYLMTGALAIETMIYICVIMVPFKTEEAK